MRNRLLPRPGSTIPATPTCRGSILTRRFAGYFVTPQLREAVEGIAEACRAFGTPVIGGNVSLYNESPAGVVDPTPTVAMVGLIEDEKHITTQWFKNKGDAIILVGPGAGVADPDSSSAAAAN